MSGYGEVVRETADERHERLVQAIEAVLHQQAGSRITWSRARRLAEDILAAVEAGF